MPTCAHRSAIALIFFLFLCVESQAAVPLSPLWDKAIEAEGIQPPEERVRLFSEWIREAEAQGVRSSDAHYHLALAHWEKKEPGHAVYQLMESAKLKQNPFAALSILGQVQQIESEQSIRDGVSSSPMLYLLFTFTPNLNVLFATLAVWCFLAAFYLVWYRQQPIGKVQVALWLAAGVFVTVPLAGVLSRSLLKPIAVTHSTGVLGVFTTAEAKDENRIISLPPGVLVVTEEVSGNMRHISQPLSGWIEAKALLPIDLMAR